MSFQSHHLKMFFHPYDYGLRKHNTPGGNKKTFSLQKRNTIH